MGQWDVAKAASMTWGTGDIWKMSTDLPVGTDIQFKASARDVPCWWRLYGAGNPVWWW